MAYGPRLEQSGNLHDSTSADAREIAPWVERFARIGFAAKALLYATIGVLAVQAALGRGGATTDTRGALTQVIDAPFGRVLLGVIALGLVGYGAWRLLAAATDAEARGSDAKGVSVRLFGAFLGIIHLGLAYTAVRLAMGRSTGSGEENGQAREATRTALDVPGGEWLVIAAGGVIVAAGFHQLYRAWSARLTKRLDLGALSPRSRRAAIGVSRFGIAARGVVLLVIGGHTIMAGIQERSDVPGISGALRSLLQVGRWPLLVVAVGFIAYAAYDLLQARYRRIRAS